MVLEVRGATPEAEPGAAQTLLRRLVDHLDRPVRSNRPLLWVTTERETPTLWVEVAWWDRRRGVRHAVRAPVPIDGLLTRSPEGGASPAIPDESSIAAQLESAIAAAAARLRAELARP